MNTDEEGRTQGPAMVVATSVMKKPPLRVAKITDDIVLPRSIPAKTIVVGAAGALIGLIIGAFFQSWTSMFYGAGIFATAAILLMNMSPLQGESIWKWLSLVWGGRKGKTASVEGEKVRLYVGICPVPRAASESTVHIWPGSVRVVAHDYDERGVRIDPRNHNVTPNDANRWSTQAAAVPPHDLSVAPGQPHPPTGTAPQSTPVASPEQSSGRKTRRRRRGSGEEAAAVPHTPPNLHAWDAPPPSPGRP